MLLGRYWRGRWSPRWSRKGHLLCKNGNIVSVNSAETHERSTITNAGYSYSGASPTSSTQEDITIDDKTVALLLASYRTMGHFTADLDPLKLSTPSKVSLNVPELRTSQREDGRLRFAGRPIYDIGQLEASLGSIYGGHVGYEFSHVDNVIEREWLYETVESLGGINAAPTLQRRLARTLLEAEAWDHFMTRRFGQVKRYGLEGSEGLMVAVDIILNLSKAEHITIAMAHRGRLNLMVGLLGFPPTAIFHKLTGASELPNESGGSADVLSHLSYTGTIEVGGRRKCKVSILPNPSHLEAINPVQQGFVYALQNFRGERTALAVQIHGDAAFSGQGVVQETLQMSQLSGFSIGGTIHIILNNQLGYTATADLGRSAIYASGPAKIIGAPIIHVNGDYPEDIARAVTVALQYQQRFSKDVVVDIICYRRHGHNELDEPTFTQPLMYKAIQNIPTLPTLYSSTLVREKILDMKDVEEIKENAYKNFERALQTVPSFNPTKSGIQKDILFDQQGEEEGMTVTGVPKKILKEIALQSIQLAPTFNVHGRLQKYHIESRLNMLREGEGGEKSSKVDWATAEVMAVGSLLRSGFNVRLVGQDVQRGTFSQRHFVFHDQKSGERIIPLNNNWSEEGGRRRGTLQVINSHLSELAVLGCEYGISIADPVKTLSIWEAQFGDFFNGAQIILDTMISSGEAKWGVQSGLVLLLPHGYDGTGPEHSSCRLERFLQTSNAPYDPHVAFLPNWHVVHPSTPANYFHLLQRQMLRPFRRPLIVASPKTLLRLPAAVSNLDDLGVNSEFQPLVDDPKCPVKAERLVFVSGKFYYEIEKEVEVRQMGSSIAVIRIEELCPLPTKLIKSILSKYSKAKSFIWCQEEHRNMGPYNYMAPRLTALLPPGASLDYIGRPEAATPAAGYSLLHKAELASIWERLFQL